MAIFGEEEAHAKSTAKQQQLWKTKKPNHFYINIYMVKIDKFIKMKEDGYSNYYSISEF